MKVVKIVILLLCIVTTNAAWCQGNIVDKTEKLLGKGKYEQALLNINKALLKDSSSASAYQAKALFYLHPTQYNIDSSHINNEIAILKMDSTPVKTLDRLAKFGLTKSYLIKYKHIIDSIAYQDALETHQLSGYNHYISQYESSAYLDSAIVQRNELAFAIAVEGNTYHGYRSFMEKYPDAMQVTKAKERFERLYYDESVEEGNLNSYISFLEEHPNSHHRHLAERQILELSTIENTPEAYLNFVSSYPNSSLRKLALDYAYHLNHQLHPAHRSEQNYYDSLSQIHQLTHTPFVPIYKNGFGFIDRLGQIMIPIEYHSDLQKSICMQVTTEYIWIAQDTTDILMNKQGSVILKEQIDHVELLGSGLLHVQTKSVNKIIHLSGVPVLDHQYEEVKLLNEQLIAFQEGKKWGLSTALGRIVIPSTYDNIVAENDFIILEKENKISITNGVELSQAVSGNFLPSFRYDDYEPWDDHHILVYEGESIQLLDKNLTNKLPDEVKDIKQVGNKIIATTNDMSYLLDGDNIEIETSSSQPIIGNKSGIYYAKDGTYYGSDGAIEADKIELFGDDFVKIHKGDSISLTYPNVQFYSKNNNFRIISKNEEAYALITSQEEFTLADIRGTTSQPFDYDKFLPVGDSLFIVSKDSKKGIIDFHGNSIVPAKYDAIQRGDSTLFTLLSDGRFGMFNLLDNSLIEPTYDKRLSSYGDGLYMAITDDLSGLVNHDGSTILPFEFDQILFWNDTSAFVKQGYQWMIYSIQENRPLLDGIAQYEVLKSSDELIFKIYKGNAYGVIHNNQGQLIPPTFYNIYAIIAGSAPIYVAEKYIEEADFYVVIYYDTDGNQFYKHAMESKYYQNVKCNSSQ